jgi:hypothetical protein
MSIFSIFWDFSFFQSKRLSSLKLADSVGLINLQNLSVAFGMRGHYGGQRINLCTYGTSCDSWVKFRFHSTYPGNHFLSWHDIFQCILNTFAFCIMRLHYEPMATNHVHICVWLTVAVCLSGNQFKIQVDIGLVSDMCPYSVVWLSMQGKLLVFLLIRFLIKVLYNVYKLTYCVCPVKRVTTRLPFIGGTW